MSLVASVPGRRRAVAAAAGVALLAGSAVTRFAVFYAWLNSAADPRYTVVPQRRRADQEAGAKSPTSGIGPGKVYRKTIY
jgi:hypothetical protein